jgi:hypothetical protein
VNSRSKKVVKQKNRQTCVISLMLVAGLAIRASSSSLEQGATAQPRSDTIREVTTMLSSKEMEGRGMAQPGGERAAQYLADKFRKAGLKPLGDQSSYLQQIKVTVQTLMPDTQLKVGDNTFEFKKDFGVAQPAHTELQEVSGSLAFVGYGVVSDDLRRNDLAGIEVKKHETGTSSNVIGMIQGSDPKLKNEAVVYTAHYDAFGMDTEGTIYPGASDNALGVGKLVALAEAFAGMTTKPRRSIIFIATTGEEYGDLGAEYWLQHPTFPIERIAADINFDGSVLELWGKLAFLLDIGFDESDLNQIVKSVAATLEVEIYPDPVPDEGFFYRSDHYAFIKRGIPAIFLVGGPAMRPNVLFARATQWQETRYHTPADVIQADWDWEGARMLASFALLAGTSIANQEKLPSWKSGSRYVRPH